MTKLVGILTINGLELKVGDILDKYDKNALRKLKTKYTIKHHNFITKIDSYIHSWVEIKNKKLLILPRTSEYKLLESKIIDDVKYEIPIVDTINLSYTGKSTYNQDIVYKYLMKNVYNKDGKKGCIMKLLAGGGKTFLAFEIIKKINKKTLIIVPNTYLLDQWVVLLTQLFPENKIGQYYTKKKINGDIVVAIINSAANSKEFTFKVSRGKYNTVLSDDFFKEFGLVIYDECHMYCTTMFKQIFNKVNVENVMGLSATPDERGDGFDKLVKFHLGDIIDAETIEGYEKNNNKFLSLVKVIKYNAPDEFSNIHINKHTKLVNVPKIMEELTSDPYRNQLIINKLVDFYNKKRNVFVFSDRREHLELLYNKFINVMIIQNKNIKSDTFIPELYKEDDNRLESSILYGGSNEEDINTARNHSKIIFTTYQYSSTGVSIVKMDTLVLATPRRNNMTQIIGRIFRLGSDICITRIIVDLLDNKSVLKGQHSERKKSYKDRESEFEKEEIDYGNINLELKNLNLNT